MRAFGIAIIPMLFVPLLAHAYDMPSPASAELCGDCHRAIYTGWKESAHAHAMESRLFQDALKLSDADLGPQARKICLGCHSPIAVQTNDMALVKKVSWEGVTCDYCHSLRQVTLGDGNPKARVEYTGPKSGPSKDMASPAHDTVYSEVHTTSSACAVCHEYKNGLGFPVLTTYSEWEASSYGKKGQPCQSCHMSLVQGDIVDPRVKRIGSETVNLHKMPGGHSLDQLTKSVRATLTVARHGDKIEATVKLVNVGAGHCVPTGSPLRQLILEVRADSYGGQHLREERVYARTVADQNGEPISHEHLGFVKAAKELSDTRLFPGAAKIETFIFEIPRGRQTRVEADLYYYYSPTAATEGEEKIKFLTMTRLLL
jgi:hypothetical protein